MGILYVAADIAREAAALGNAVAATIAALGYVVAVGELMRASRNSPIEVVHARAVARAAAQEAAGVVDQMADRTRRLAIEIAQSGARADESVPDATSKLIETVREEYARQRKVLRLAEERAEKLAEEVQKLDAQKIASARRNLRASDLMLVLMILGVVGTAVCLIMSLFVVAPIVAGVAPTVYLAHRRLKKASDESELSSHDAEMRSLERENAKLDLELKGIEVRERKAALAAPPSEPPKED